MGGLTSIIEALNPKRKTSHWTDYERTSTYSAEETGLKSDLVRDVLSKIAAEKNLNLTWGIGANTGTYSLIAADFAKTVLAMDNDPAVVDAIFSRCGETDTTSSKNVR